MAIQRKNLPGGYRFTRFAGQPEPRLEEAGIPEAVAVPLALPQPYRAAEKTLAAMVQPGDPVRAGQIIARDDDAVGSPVISSVNGSVEEIREVPWFEGTVRAVIIRSDGTDSWKPLSGFAAQWQSLTPEALEKLLYLSGAAGLSPDGIPTHFNSSCLNPGEVEDIILQGAQTDAFNPAPEALLQGRQPGEPAEGLAILARIMPGARLHLVSDRKRKALAAEVEKACRSLGLKQVQLHTIGDKYPHHRAELLIPALLGREFPYGYAAINLGVVVLDLQALLQVRDAIVTGKPVIDRVVALAGSGFLRRPHLRLRIGAPLGAALEPHLRKGREARLVRNSALSGKAIVNPNQPADTHLAALIAIPEKKAGPPLAFARPGFRTDSISRTFLANFVPFTKTTDTNIHGEHRPCISCTYCDSVCPAGLLPHLLHRYVQRGIIDEALVRYRIFDCIDCNLCTYVCTSKIPLARLILEGKERLAAEGLDPRKETAARLGLKGVER